MIESALRRIAAALPIAYAEIDLRRCSDIGQYAFIR
jgi:hypothetical protein